MRPILFDVDIKMRPARMTICFPGRPKRFIVVSIKAPVTTEDEAKAAAFREMGAWTLDQLVLLSESAQPAPVIADEDAMAATISMVEQEERYSGLIHCPACCRPLGRGDSPAIGYLTSCPGCKKSLMVRFAPGAFTVFVWPE